MSGMAYVRTLKIVIKLTDHLAMNLVVDWDVKPQNNKDNRSSKRDLKAIK